MLKVLNLGLGALRAARRVTATGFPQPGPGAGANYSTHTHTHTDTRTHPHTRIDANTHTRSDTHTHSDTHTRTCTVDPKLEEQFVFEECTDDPPAPVEPPLSSSTAPEPMKSLRSAASEPGPMKSLRSAASEPGPMKSLHSAASDPGPMKTLRSLERQLEALGGVAMTKEEEEEPNDLITFHDVDFLPEENATATKTQKKKKKPPSERGEHRVFGTADPSQPVSAVSCCGCGALLHCTDPSVAGFMPSEKLRSLGAEGGLQGATCQRCHLLTHHHKALALSMTPEEYRVIVQRLRPLKALVLLLVDLMDVPASIVTDLSDIIGDNKQVVVIGNKIDLLPGDAPNYLQRIKKQLNAYCEEAGFLAQVTDTHLISAKTGYGVEQLISGLQRTWRYHGDVYLVGMANSGKSTLFNCLLTSDYCKSNASDVIHKATISPWPGTTLNLLKFPIINPTPYRMFKRQERLNEAKQQTETQLTANELAGLELMARKGYLVGRVGRTFRSEAKPRSDEITFDPDSLAFGEEGETARPKAPKPPPPELTFNEVKDAHWLFDTPGIMKQNDLLSVLTEQEVMSVVPSQAVVPRTFVLKPGTVLFVGGVARIDFIQGGKSCWFSVMVSSRVPVHLTSLEKADSVYEKHAGHILLGVPAGGWERMESFPALVPQDFSLEGRGYTEASADITLSSAGWVSVTAALGDQVVLKVHGPAEKMFGLRRPPLLPHVVSLKGERIRKSAAYKPVKPLGLLDSGLSAQGAEKLHVKDKKKKKKKLTMKS